MCEDVLESQCPTVMGLACCLLIFIWQLKMSTNLCGVHLKLI